MRLAVSKKRNQHLKNIRVSIQVNFFILLFQIMLTRKHNFQLTSRNRTQQTPRHLKSFSYPRYLQLQQLIPLSINFPDFLLLVIPLFLFLVKFLSLSMLLLLKFVILVFILLPTFFQFSILLFKFSFLKVKVILYILYGSFKVILYPQ